MSDLGNVVSALVVSTMLCLVVVPAFYVTDGWKQRLFAPEKSVPPTPAPVPAE